MSSIGNTGDGWGEEGDLTDYVKSKTIVTAKSVMEKYGFSETRVAGRVYKAITDACAKEFAAIPDAWEILAQDIKAAHNGKLFLGDKFYAAYKDKVKVIADKFDLAAILKKMGFLNPESEVKETASLNTFTKVAIEILKKSGLREGGLRYNYFWDLICRIEPIKAKDPNFNMWTVCRDLMQSINQATHTNQATKKTNFDSILVCELFMSVSGAPFKDMLSKYFLPSGFADSVRSIYEKSQPAHDKDLLQQLCSDVRSTLSKVLEAIPDIADLGAVRERIVADFTRQFPIGPAKDFVIDKLNAFLDLYIPLTK